MFNTFFASLWCQASTRRPDAMKRPADNTALE